MLKVQSVETRQEDDLNMKRERERRNKEREGE